MNIIIITIHFSHIPVNCSPKKTKQPLLLYQKSNTLPVSIVIALVLQDRSYSIAIKQNSKLTTPNIIIFDAELFRSGRGQET